MVKFLIEEKECDHTQTWQYVDGHTLVSGLHLACIFGQLDIVRYLVEKKNV